MGTHALDSLLAATRSARRVWGSDSADTSEQRFFERYDRICKKKHKIRPNISKHLSLPPEDNAEAVLRLNIGGCSFWLHYNTIIKMNLTKTLIHQMAKYSHEYRLRICTSYLEKSREYFFERSPALFRPIHVFYLTGEVRKPELGCTDLFAKELRFWVLEEEFFSICCYTHQVELVDILDDDKRLAEEEYAQRFNNIVCGPLRKEIWNLLEEPESSTAARVCTCLSVMAILVSNTALILGSIERFRVPVKMAEGSNSTSAMTEPHPNLEYIDYGCIAIFTVEYLLRLLVSPDRKRVFLDTMNLVDFVAIVPSYIEFLLNSMGIFESGKFQDFSLALLVFRVLRVLRVTRLFKLGRHSSGLRMFAMTLQRSRAQLGMTAMVLSVCMMFFSSMVYFAEKDNPDTKFVNIPIGLWWVLVTMTTVGYGDIYPTTVVAKIIASAAIASGVLVIALPITVVVENYVQLRAELLSACHSTTASKRRTSKALLKT